MFGIDKGGNSALSLGTCNRMKRKGCLAGRFRSKNFGTSIISLLPNFIIDPLPNWRSICPIAVSTALSFSGVLLMPTS
jgi:hypothetical protein